jgi:galactokinase
VQAKPGAPGQVRAFAPGRVNLIGEHTDYNRGLCLPFAVERGVTVTAAPTGGDAFEVHATTLGEVGLFQLESRKPEEGWRAYVKGALVELAGAGADVPPARVEIVSDLPIGAGLGSSASLTVALCLALLALAGSPEPDRVELARLCSRVENDWVGARTGLLDQLAVLFGRRGEAVRLDMASLEVAPVPLDLGGAVLATLDSGAQHEHAASGYNARRDECDAACRALGLRSLRNALPEDVERLPDPLDRRARHVLSENERVDAMVAALWRGDLAAVGALLDASHASLRDDYEVSTPEVERTVTAAKEAGAIGARIVGGGFGGHVLALFPEGADPPEGALPVQAGPGASLL